MHEVFPRGEAVRHRSGDVAEHHKPSRAVEDGVVTKVPVEKAVARRLDGQGKAFLACLEGRDRAFRGPSRRW